MLSIVAPGTSFTVEHYFVINNAPLAATTPAAFNIRDFNNNLVMSGIGQQDVLNPAHWTATITLPSTVPVGTPDQRYSLNWQAANDTQVVQSTELFSVLPSEDYTFVENDKLVLERGKITDSLLLPAYLNVTDVEVSVSDEFGNVAYSGVINIATKSAFYDKQAFKLITPGTIPTLVADQSGMRPFIVTWNYFVDNNAANPEYHFLYIINNRMLLAMNDVRRMIDKARNADVNPNLAYSDVDLVHYIQIGLQKLNNYAPQLTNWTINTIPPNFTVALTYCAAWEALSAQMLAEGESAFDLTGQAVSLNVDRTPALESALGRLDAWIEANVPRGKKIWARMGSGSGISAGVLGVSVGPSLNRAFNASLILSRMRTMGSGNGGYGGNSWGGGF